MLFYGLFQEINFVVILLTLVSLLFLSPILYLAFFRRMRVEADRAVWLTPRVRRELPWREIKYYGVIKYRSFRFMFISRAADIPFQDPQKPVISDEDTFLVQFRRKGWERLKARVHDSNPQLKPINIVRK